jgi:AcrR family transcriptional regulator
MIALSRGCAGQMLMQCRRGSDCMPRVIKHPEVRRAEILDEAFRIFLERGYDNASLNDVINEAGLSKGMFYHHFESKEALLLALFDRISDETYEGLRPILVEEGLDPLERLQRVLNRSAELRLEQAQATRSVFAAFHRPESAHLYDGISRAWIERFRPVLTSIIEDGVAEGMFDTFDAEGVAQMILEHAIGTKDLITAGLNATSLEERDAGAERLARRLRLYALALSRTLGLRDGSLTIGKPKFAYRLFELLNPRVSGLTKRNQKKSRRNSKSRR